MTFCTRLETYTNEVLSWSVGDDINSQELVTDLNSNTEFCNATNLSLQDQTKRLLHQGMRRNAQWYIFLGCDVSGISVALSHLVNEETTQILIIENDFRKARSYLQTHTPLNKNIHLLADNSPWALYLLSLNQDDKASTPTPDNSIIHWNMPPKERNPVLNTWRKLFLGAKKTTVPAQPLNNFKLSVGAIIHPDETHLDDFFAHIPAFVHEVVVVWDTYIPDFAQNLQCKTKVKHYTRALNNDFAAQRNYMLKQCNGNWLLYLDADERLPDYGFEQLAYLANLHKSNEPLESDSLGGLLFPRMTFEGDANHVRMGHGLWPDVQLRFFPLNNTVHFEGSVHEKVHGLTQHYYLAPYIPILHYSHIYKNAEELKKRLAVFSAAGSVNHKLSQAYPRLMYDFFKPWLVTQPYIFQLPS